jgi:hypothetical protein
MMRQMCEAASRSKKLAETLKNVHVVHLDRIASGTGAAKAAVI